MNHEPVRVGTRWVAVRRVPELEPWGSPPERQALSEVRRDKTTGGAGPPTASEFQSVALPDVGNPREVSEQQAARCARPPASNVGWAQAWLPGEAMSDLARCRPMSVRCRQTSVTSRAAPRGGIVCSSGLQHALNRRTPPRRYRPGRSTRPPSHRSSDTTSSSLGYTHSRSGAPPDGCRSPHRGRSPRTGTR